MAKVFLFCYGTLQPGFGNFREELLAGEHFPGQVHGRIYWMCPGSYPVAKLLSLEDNPAAGEENRIVKGTWMSVDPESYEFKSVANMEIGAGYCVRTVRDAKTGMAGIAFHYRYRPNLKYEIEDGDWATAYQNFNDDDDEARSFYYDEEFENSSQD